MKSNALKKLKKMASAGKCRLVYFDEAGFCASPPVQYGWSPLGQPHQLEPKPHCRRSVLGVLDYTANKLFHVATANKVQRTTVIQFLDEVAQEGHCDQPTIVVLDNARIHHNIDQATLDRWLTEYRMMLFYLPAYSPELNLIEMVWREAKYHWRRFVTWSRETFDAELSNLLHGYGNQFSISFS